MVIRTSSAFITTCSGSTRLWPIIQRMIFQFFPAVAFIAIILIFAAIFVFGYKNIGFPMLASYWIVLVLVRFSTIILPVVRVDALASIVVKIVKRTPDCFIIKNEKVVIKFVVVNKFDSDISFGMSKRAIGSVFTVGAIFGKLSAVLSLIFVGRIKLFNLIMSLGTFITLGTIFGVLFCKIAHVWNVLYVSSSSIFLRVVKFTLFVVVRLHISARVNLKNT